MSAGGGTGHHPHAVIELSAGAPWLPIPNGQIFGLSSQIINIHLFAYLSLPGVQVLTAKQDTWQSVHLGDLMIEPCDKQLNTLIMM